MLESTDSRKRPANVVGRRLLVLRSPGEINVVGHG
jgi:hypothetical protein